MNRHLQFVLILAVYLVTCTGYGQTITPNLQDVSKWQMSNRSSIALNEDGKKAIQLNELPGDGLMILKDTVFSNGVIELDIRGSNKMQQSFVGIAFHGKDLKTYDAVYFRPFNFKSDDPVRRSHSVQYISMPDNDWEKLRTSFPGKYEHSVEPAPNPDDWFHVKINVTGKRISVYVNNQQQPSLEIDKLNDNTRGRLALWAGNNSAGTFANLRITTAGGSPVLYGNNPAAGHYFDVGDAKLYYEVYGKGKPIVLLHGGIYGYIDEFKNFIDKLIPDYQVICIATRGHGKSESGPGPFSYNQRAEDAFKVTRSITSDSVLVLGFSDGAYSGLKLAALHPELVKKLISIGAGDYPPGGRQKKYNYTADGLMKSDSAFFASRLALMPEPKRWNETLAKATHMYNEDFVSTETFGQIKCPALIMAGDRDGDNPTENVVKCYKAIRNAQLAIIPGCNHVVFFCNFPAVWQSIEPFLKKM